MRFHTLLFASLSACTAAPIGSYSVDLSTTQDATCLGSQDGDDPVRWGEALHAGSIDRVGIADIDGVTVLWTLADDWTRLLVPIENTDVGYTGVADWSSQSVGGAHLGAAWSALLEDDDLGCEFDLHGDATATPLSGWQEIVVTTTIVVSQPMESEHACVVAECSASWTVTAHRTGDGDAGIPGEP